VPSHQPDPAYCKRILHIKNNCSSVVAKIQRSKPSALPSRLKQTNTGTHRNIQTFHAAQHRDAHQLVAGLARQAAQPFAFRAQHPGQSAAMFEAMQILLRFARRTRCQIYSRLRTQSSRRSFRYNRPARYKSLLWRVAG
jgi:hypothetical protein